MDYIIIWRSNHREPFVDVDTHDFKETYSTYELAERAAKEVIANDPNSIWYHDFEIFEKSNG